jgi:flagellar basal body-associated protein FliL
MAFRTDFHHIRRFAPPLAAGQRLLGRLGRRPRSLSSTILFRMPFRTEFHTLLASCARKAAPKLDVASPPGTFAWPLKFALPIPRLLAAMLRAPLLALALAALAGMPAHANEGGDKAKKPEHKTTQSKSYIMVDPIYTTIVADNQAKGMLMVGAGLDIPDDKLREMANRSMPVLRDAYIRNLMAFTANVVRTDAQPDVGMIADRLQAVTDRALKKKGAKVLLAQVAIRVTK